MAYFMEEQGSEPVFKFFRVICFQPAVADYAGCAGAESQSHDSPNPVFEPGFFNLAGGIPDIGINIEAGVSNDFGEGIACPPGKKADNGIGRITFAF